MSTFVIRLFGADPVKFCGTARHVNTGQTETFKSLTELAEFIDAFRDLDGMPSATLSLAHDAKDASEKEDTDAD